MMIQQDRNRFHWFTFFLNCTYHVYKLQEQEFLSQLTKERRSERSERKEEKERETEKEKKREKRRVNGNYFLGTHFDSFDIRFILKHTHFEVLSISYGFFLNPFTHNLNSNFCFSLPSIIQLPILSLSNANRVSIWNQGYKRNSPFPSFQENFLTFTFITSSTHYLSPSLFLFLFF